jgi:hypothetical protein
MVRPALLAWIVVAGVLSPGRSATVTIGASKDNSIFQSNPLNSDGGGAGIFSGTNGMGTSCRGLIAFDVAGNVPPGSTITSVRLTQYLGMSPNTDPQNIELHQLFRDWGEGTAGNTTPKIMMSGMGYPAGDGDATWSDAMFGSVTWTHPGAADDFEAASSATTIASGPVDTPYTWESTAALVQDVQGWLESPTTNFGWVLINTNEGTARSQKAFYSRDATQNSSGVTNSLDPTWRPNLTITFVNSAPPTGDFNGNGEVDAADYVVWRNNFGQPAYPAGSGADGNQSGHIDAGDLDFWRARFGNVVGSPGFAASVPEHSTCTLCGVASLLVFFLRKR